MDLVSLVGQVQRGRHPRQAPADHQRVLVDAERLLVQRLGERDFRNGAVDEVHGLLGGLFGLFLVHPRAVLADVGELEHVRVDARLLERLLEERLVRSRRAGGHDEAVETLGLDHFLDYLLGVLRAGEEHVLDVLDARQLRCVFHDLLDVHGRGDVYAAPADEHAHPGRLAAEVLLVGVFDGDYLDRQLAHGSGGRRCGAAGFHDRFGDVLRSGNAPAGEHAGAGRIDRRQRPDPQEAAPVDVHAHGLGGRGGARRRLEPDRKHQKVKRLGVHRPVLSVVLHDQVVAVGVAFDRGDSPADVPRVVLDLGPVDEPVEPLAVGPHVHVENGRPHVRQVLMGDDRIFGGLHAADG